jgi:hypothetical protein
MGDEPTAEGESFRRFVEVYSQIDDQDVVVDYSRIHLTEVVHLKD